MMMTTRNDIKDRLIHNQSPYPTKDKVLSYTIPVDHSETLLFCSSNSSSNSSASGVSNGANGSNCNNGSLNFITSDDDPCNGRDLASFLDEGLGTSLDGVDEIASPIFPTLGRNDSGVFSSDEGTGAGAGATLPQTLNNGTHSQNSHPRVIPPTISSTPNACSSSGNAASSRLCIPTTSTNNLLSSGEVVSWKSLSGVSPIATSAPPTSSLALSQTVSAPTTATISVVTDSVTGIPSIICTATIPPPPVHTSSDKSNCSNSNNRGVNNNHNSTSPLAKVEVPQVSSKQSNSGKGTSQQPTAQQQQRNKSMPLVGRQGPQKCTICDKVFSNASALTKHKLTHSDERRHACATCGKAFKRQDHLNGHMLTHRNKKPFECKSKGCGKSYCDARSLRRHVENRHGHEVLESMNLTSQKHGNKNSNNNSNNSNSQHNSSNFANNNQPEPQPELVQFAPVKSEPTEGNNSRKNNVNKTNSPKTLDRMPVLQPEPQLELDFNTHLNNPEKVNISAKPLISLSSSVPQRGSSPPTLHKVGESSNSTSGTTTHFLNASTSVTGSGLPILVKRENVSVFDFDEALEDVGNPGVPCISSNVTTHGNQQQHDKFLPSAIKVSGIIDPAKLGSFPDLKLFQEWSKRLSDSKAVALFLASSSSAASSFAQLAGPITSNSLQFDGRPSSVGSLTMSGSSHAFIPTNENGLFSVTPISIVPTSSGEFTLKPANLPMNTNGAPTEPPKPLYILPSDPILSGGLPPSTLPVSTHISNNVVATEPPPPIVQQNTKAVKESKGKEKGKSGGIGANLVNRIKTKLKAGSMKKSSKSGESKNAPSSKVANQHQNNQQASPVPVIGKQSTLDNDVGGKPILVCHQAHPQSGGILPTLSITGSMNGGGIVSWTCESPNDSLMNGLEEESLSEGGVDGEDKPVECSICKETEGSKKKEVSKEQGHSTPLQTASVSVRALIEEKIKERRNNLLKLAAAAAAEKAASEAAGSQLPEISSSQTTSPSALLNFNGQKAKLSETPSSSGNVIAQEQQQSTKLLMENIKLKIGSTNLLPSSEKDKNCDHQVNLSNNNTTDIISTNSMPSLTNSNSINGNNNDAPVNMDPSFQDLNIIIGNNNSLVGLGAMTNANDLSSLTPLERETIHLHPSTGTIIPSSFPLQVDRSNFTLLDCGINPDDLCQAVHLIYVNNGGGNNRTIDLPLGALNQDPLGKVSKVLQQPLPAMSTLLPERLMGDNRRSSLKGIMEPLVVCPSTTPSGTLDDPCNLPWEWRNSTSSDNTDNSLSHVQDCVNSLLCSSSSDILDESCTKDPVAGGGYCYTPILSPNSSFCLTPGPDSPFEAAQPNQSLSFICPSPSIGSGSIYSSDPSVSSLVNPPSSVEPIFSPEQSQPLPSNSVNTTPTSELMKQHHTQHQQQPELQNSILTSALDQLHSQSVHGEVVNVSSQQLLSSNLPHELINRQHNNGMESLPSINTFPTINNNIGISMGISDGSYIGPRDVILQCPMPININNEGHQQQSFVPFEVYTPYPIPKRVCDKWINGKVRRNKKIHVGPDYQAELPNCKGNKGRKQGHGRDEKLWDPSILDSCSFDEVDKYLEFACCSAVPGGGMNKEYALHLLTLSKGNIREAILRLMEKLPALPAKLRNYSYLENQKWSSEEIITFQISLIQMGKDFAKIAKAVGTKTKAECVCFYYFWKKVCFSEFQIMKQIWKDRLDHQQLQQQQQTLNATISSINNPFICNSNGFGNNDMGFLVPAHDVRSTCK